MLSVIDCLNFIKIYVSPAPKLPPAKGDPLEEAGPSLPGQESAEEEELEEKEETGTQKDPQKALDKGQQAQQLEGNDITR